MKFTGVFLIRKNPYPAQGQRVEYGGKISLMPKEAFNDLYSESKGEQGRRHNLYAGD